jgi:hypothetical protein
MHLMPPHSALKQTGGLFSILQRLVRRSVRNVERASAC